MSDYIIPAVISFLATLGLVVFARWLFPKIGMMDRPHKYGLKRSPIPYYGGALIFVVFLVMVLIFVPLDKAVIGLLIGAAAIVFIGFLDDMFSVSPFIRLLFQLFAGVALVLSGVFIFSINIPFIGVLDMDGLIYYGIPVISSVFTIVWIMAIVNTMNFIDGVSGLASGVGFIAGLTIFVLSIHPGIHENPQSQVGVALIALILSMSCLAFLLFDFPKPKILMGDTGSTFIGFIIATLAIFSGGKVATAFLVLGIPILDMIWVVLRRTLSGQKFWKGDLKHLHHRFLDIGLSERHVVLLYLAVTAVFGISAVSFVSSEQKFFILIALVVLMFLLASALVFLPRKR